MVKVTSNSRLLRSSLLCVMGLTLTWSAVGSGSGTRQGPDKIELERGHAMLAKIKEELQKNYYDPSFHGIDIEAQFKLYDEKLRQAKSNNHVFAIIAQFLLDLNDSHTIFTPPARRGRVEYGWRMAMIGDTCYVIAVKPGSDAAAKGVRPGDIIHKIAELQPTRQTLWKIQYLISFIAPQGALPVVLQSPTGARRDLNLTAKVTEGQQVTDLASANVLFDAIRKAENVAHLYRNRLHEMGDDLILWKMPTFDVTESEVDSAMGKARGHKGLAIDLRGNSGGAETALLRLLSHFFEKDTKIGDLIRRKETKPMMVKARHGDLFAGRVVILVDSKSASAAEVFARIMQIEKRATILGDNTLGLVMRSRYHPFTDGIGRVVFYGASITDADLIMSDGKRLEGIGVTPDEIARPTGADLAAGRDPVLARAAALLGVSLNPEAAGKLFPVEWLKDN